jgi:hypothetical protein
LFRIPPKDPVYIPKEDFAKLLAAIRDHCFRHLVLFAALTGMRRGELLSLRWSDIDQSARLIRIRNKDDFTVKGMRSRSIPINRDLFSLILKMPRESEHVFVTRTGSPMMAHPSPKSSSASYEHVTCPAGKKCSLWYEQRTKTKRGTIFRNKCFMFRVDQCGTCSLRPQCVRPTAARRTLSVHEHEELLQQAKVYQRTDEYRTLYRQRVVVEHRLARLIRLGVRKARYVGSTKVLFQLAMAATVANLTLLRQLSAQSCLLGLLPHLNEHHNSPWAREDRL